MSSSTDPTVRPDLSDADLDRLAARLAPRLAAALAPAHPEWADKDHNPYGSERAFLDVARRGDFKSFRRNRRITARWVDVAAAIESSKGAGRRKVAPATAPGNNIDVDRLLREAKPRRGRERTDG
jgi:hypothetical protein